MSANEYDPLVPVSKLIEVIDDIFLEFAGLKYSQDPEFVKKEIIEYDGRWRTFGPEKFNDSCYLSAINFFKSQKDFDKDHPIGTMIFYLKLEHAVELYNLLNLGADEDDEDSLLECCGAILNIIAEKFKGALADLGYPELLLSTPVTRENNISEGVIFNIKEREYFELSFFLWKTKSFVFSFYLGKLDQV